MSHSSNFFRLQVEELIKELQITKSTKVEKFLRERLHPLITGCKPQKVILKTDSQGSGAKCSKANFFTAEFGGFCEHLRLYNEYNNAVHGRSEQQVDVQREKTFEFLPPTRMEIVGSYQLDLVSNDTSKHGNNKCIDLLVFLPDDLFQSKDYANYRYHDKRALYLACLATQLKKELGAEAVCSWEFLDHNLYKPVLNIRPQFNSSRSKSSSWLIRIVTSVEDSCEALSDTGKMATSRNCLRRLMNPTRSEEEDEPSPVDVAKDTGVMKVFKLNINSI